MIPHRILVGFAKDHDEMARGIEHFSYVVVLAPNTTEAQFIACGFAACHGIPTSTTLIEE